MKSWFIQAIPAASEYIELNDSREVIVRFRLTSSDYQLSLWGQPNPAYYLGHNPDAPVTPRKVALDIKNEQHVFDRNIFWSSTVEMQTVVPLFNPNS